MIISPSIAGRPAPAFPGPPPGPDLPDIPATPTPFSNTYVIHSNYECNTTRPGLNCQGRRETRVRQANWRSCSRCKSGREEKASHHSRPESCVDGCVEPRIFPWRSRWSEGPSPRAIRRDKARAERRVGKACPRRSTGYGNSWNGNHRSVSRRLCTTSAVALGQMIDGLVDI